MFVWEQLVYCGSGGELVVRGRVLSLVVVGGGSAGAQRLEDDSEAKAEQAVGPDK